MNLPRQLAPAILFAGLALAGCTTQEKTVDLGNGVTGYHITCGGLPISSSDDCESRAASLCGDNGYTILKEDSPPYAHTERAWQETTHDITVSCKSSQMQQEPRFQ